MSVKRAHLSDTNSSIALCGAEISYLGAPATYSVRAIPEGVLVCKACRDAEKTAARPAGQMRPRDAQKAANRLMRRIYMKTPREERPDPRRQTAMKVFVMNLATTGDADAIELAKICGWPTDGPQLVETAKP